MKRYEYKKYVMADFIPQNDAEGILNHKIINLWNGTDGYLVKEVESDEKTWVPATVFEKYTTVDNTPIDKIKIMIKDTDNNLKWLKTYTSKNYTTTKKRNRLYLAMRRTKALKQDLEKILQIMLTEL